MRNAETKCMDAPTLPPTLLSYLPDSSIEVVSWDAATDELLLRVSKEIGNETGVIRFTQVSHVNLAPRFTIANIACGGLELLPTDYLTAFRPGNASLDAGERVFLLEDSWGPQYFVIAESIGYAIAEESAQ